MHTKPTITVVDAIMGSGKTSWSIDYINQHKEKNFLYVTPFLEEVKRVMNSTDREFKEPINRGTGKLSSLNELLQCQEDIVSTHCLFSYLDEDSQNFVEQNNYTLILDEVLNVIEPYRIKKNDMQILIDSGCVSIDKEGFVIWNPNKSDYETQFDEVKSLAESKSLVFINNTMLLWRYPPEIFSMFNEIYVLTYLFEASILKYYFDANEIKYNKQSISSVGNKLQLVPYFLPDLKVYRPLINIYDGVLNSNIKQKESTFSSTWFSSSSNNNTIKKLRNNLYNYFRNVVSADAETILWTTFKSLKSKLKGKGYTKGFLSCNCRATNDYGDRENLAYVLNVFPHPAITQYFEQHYHPIDNELYAVSEMIQWIWRSRIRNGQTINIYIPSMRMRRLLEWWLLGRINKGLALQKC